MKWGQLEIFEIPTGRFCLDGGSMFGTVPRVLWEKSFKCNKDHQIELAARCLLIKGPDFNCLIDAGMGTKWNKKMVDIFKIKNLDIKKQIKKIANLEAEQITHVIATHLHFDHVGGLTEQSAGKIVPTFPKAKVFISQSNLKNAKNPNPREKASYLKENFECLEKKGLFQVVELNPGQKREVLPNIYVERCDGHTVGLQTVHIINKKSSIVYAADMLPTSAHIPLAWIMGYDIDPQTQLKEKFQLLKELSDKRSKHYVFFEHDPEICLASVEKYDRKDGSKDFKVKDTYKELKL